MDDMKADNWGKPWVAKKASESVVLSVGSWVAQLELLLAEWLVQKRADEKDGRMVVDLVATMVD
jgi:hypothetical protein